MKNSNKLIIITGPSGVGKGTVVKDILQEDKNCWLSISATTRNPREGEMDGRDYYFLDKAKFMQMISDGLFLEWAEFAGNYYGTPLNSVREKIDTGFTVILEIEVEGARQIRSKFPNSLSIFLLPPSKEELERRIRDRGTENEESIKKRLRRADFEMKSSVDFDHVLENISVKETVRNIFEIIK
tara:strand:- start:2181 stop:2732 length:552 start_codon:yes stop_codon:yes gene_type:complete